MRTEGSISLEVDARQHAQHAYHEAERMAAGGKVSANSRKAGLFSWHTPTDYFDQIAATYALVEAENTPGGRARRVRRARVLELFDKPGGKVLDVGCGPGVTVEGMLSQRCAFWGVDGSFKMIKQCHKRYPICDRAHFTVGNAAALSFPNGFFDAVTCLGVIDRVPEHELAVREMSRVLKEGGTLIIAVPNLLSPGGFWRNFIFSPLVAVLRPVYYRLTKKARKPAMAPIARLHRASTFKKLVAACGCVTTDLVYFNFNLLPSPLDEIFPRSAVWVADHAERLRFGIFKWLGAGFILKAKKCGGRGRKL